MTRFPDDETPPPVTVPVTDGLYGPRHQEDLVMGDLKRKKPSVQRPSAGDLRFPCGHVEPEDVTERRMRLRGRVVWVACRRCNVIAVAVSAA